MIVTEPVDVPGPTRRQAGVARGAGISYASALLHRSACQSGVAPAPKAADPIPPSRPEATRPQPQKKQQRHMAPQQLQQAAPQWPVLGRRSQESSQAQAAPQDAAQALSQEGSQAVRLQPGKKQQGNAWGLRAAPGTEARQKQSLQSQPQHPPQPPPQPTQQQSQQPQPRPEPKSQPSQRAVEQSSDHEFDFDDVFGPSPASSGRLSSSSSLDSSHDASSGRLATASGRNLRTVAEMDEDDLAGWMADEQLPDLAAGIPGDEPPEIITHRSHSLVGPAAITPRQSVARSNSRRSSLDEPDSARPSLMGTSPSMRQCSLESPRKAVARAMLEAGMAAEGRGGTAAEAAVAVVGAEGGRESDATGAVEPETEIATEKADRIGPEDFELLRVVGQGAFGKVFQVQQRWTGEIFAMKVMKKHRILERNQGDYMRAEREILTKVVHPFIVQLQYSFQTSAKLYLILDFINGGHLFFQLYRHGTFSEDLARIYTAELVLAVGHLHSRGIMHRDLKPENILLDSDGHIKLTDFGLAKEVRASDARSNSLCGTMEYMAPEIIQAHGHGFPADWWSIGILLYEMLTGQPPFSGGNRQKLQQRIVKEKVKLPNYLTSEAHSLLRGLLQKDPAKRLGSGPRGVEEIRAHKWFKGVHWQRLEARQVQPLFLPAVTGGKRCTANFDTVWTQMPVHDSPAGTPTMGGADAFFRNYTFIASHAALSTVDSDSDGEVGSGGSEERDEEEEEEEEGGEGGKGEEEVVERQ
ncbi:hypothetical protein CLOM_g895 [Closterium sp. NIES-68]|nr:hypothetical protein CLOM_g895 [Closterium sp. NIES-68]GJP65952.1 hypothetical protein CLOP_g22844 [Closterium sp. NIES-67]